MAKLAAQRLRQRGVDVKAFSDANVSRWGTVIDGIPLIPPEEIVSKYPAAAVLIATSLYDSEISEELGKLGCSLIYSMPYLNYCLPDVFVSREYHHLFDAAANRDNHGTMRQVWDLIIDDESRKVFQSKLLYMLTLDKAYLNAIRTSHPIYLDPAIMPLSQTEVFADGGAFTGDTLRDFLHVTGGAFQGYYAFEPDERNLERLHAIARTDPARIHVIQAGLAEQSGTLFFTPTGSYDSKFTTFGSVASIPLPVVSLDDYFQRREPPTFIKLDVEGSEFAALRGGCNIIKQHCPRIATSVYHCPQDLWELPSLLHSLNGKYRFIFRHCTREIDDTVCYALLPG